jgi:hypothetical protein
MRGMGLVNSIRLNSNPTSLILSLSKDEACQVSHGTH